MLIAENITTIEDLVQELKDIKSEAEYKKVVKRLDIPLEQYKPFMFWSKDHYTRNCIVRTDEFELILLCWLEGQETPVHCHNNQECWVYVVEGEFDEQRFVDSDKKEEDLEVDTQLQLEEDGVSYMNDDMGYHSLANTSEGRAMSLHLYMNPIDECNVFNEETGEFERKVMKYDSFEGKKID